MAYACARLNNWNGSIFNNVIDERSSATGNYNSSSPFSLSISSTEADRILDELQSIGGQNPSALMLREGLDNSAIRFECRRAAAKNDGVACFEA